MTRVTRASWSPTPSLSSSLPWTNCDWIFGKHFTSRAHFIGSFLNRTWMFFICSILQSKSLVTRKLIVTLLLCVFCKLNSFHLIVPQQIDGRVIRWHQGPFRQFEPSQSLASRFWRKRKGKFRNKDFNAKIMWYLSAFLIVKVYNPTHYQHHVNCIFLLTLPYKQNH